MRGDVCCASGQGRNYRWHVADILLDGLDEVTSSEDRFLLVARLEAFVRWQKETSNCLIVTSRVIGYADFPLAIDAIYDHILSDFDDEEIVQFVDKVELSRRARGEGRRFQFVNGGRGRWIP